MRAEKNKNKNPARTYLGNPPLSLPTENCYENDSRKKVVIKNSDPKQKKEKSMTHEMKPAAKLSTFSHTHRRQPNTHTTRWVL